MELSRQIIGWQVLPIHLVNANLPPVWIVHGGAEAVGLLQRSERFAAKVKEVGAARSRPSCGKTGHGRPSSGNLRKTLMRLQTGATST